MTQITSFFSSHFFTMGSCIVQKVAKLLTCNNIASNKISFNHGSLALDSTVVWKISKHHFFSRFKNSFHGVTGMGLKPHRNFFQNLFSTNMAARGVQSFYILEGATGPLIEQWLKFSCQFSPDMWWTNAENFKSISWTVSELWSFNWKILAIARLRS